MDGAPIPLRTQPMRENATLRAMLAETADLMGALDYANPESKIAAQAQIEAVQSVLTDVSRPD